MGTWLLALRVAGTRDYKVTGTGTTEYRYVLSTSLQVFGLLAILAYLFKTQIGRGFFLLALPIGILGLLLSRWLWRKWLLKQRSKGLYIHRAVVVGEFQKNALVK